MVTASPLEELPLDELDELEELELELEELLEEELLDEPCASMNFATSLEKPLSCPLSL